MLRCVAFIFFNSLGALSLLTVSCSKPYCCQTLCASTFHSLNTYAYMLCTYIVYQDILAQTSVCIGICLCIWYSGWHSFAFSDPLRCCQYETLRATYGPHNNTYNNCATIPIYHYSWYTRFARCCRCCCFQDFDFVLLSTLSGCHLFVDVCCLALTCECRSFVSLLRALSALAQLV